MTKRNNNLKNTNLQKYLDIQRLLNQDKKKLLDLECGNDFLDSIRRTCIVFFQ